MIDLMSDAVGLAANGRVIFLRVIKPINHFAPLYLRLDPLLGVNLECIALNQEKHPGFQKAGRAESRCMLLVLLRELLPWLPVL